MNYEKPIQARRDKTIYNTAAPKEQVSHGFEKYIYHINVKLDVFKLSYATGIWDKGAPKHSCSVGLKRNWTLEMIPDWVSPATPAPPQNLVVEEELQEFLFLLIFEFEMDAPRLYSSAILMSRC